MKESLSNDSPTRAFTRKECPYPVPLVGNSVEIFDSGMNTSRSARLERTEVASQRLKDGLLVTISCFYRETGLIPSSA